MAVLPNISAVQTALEKLPRFQAFGKKYGVSVEIVGYAGTRIETTAYPKSFTVADGNVGLKLVYPADPNALVNFWNDVNTGV